MQERKKISREKTALEYMRRPRTATLLSFVFILYVGEQNQDKNPN
jgi:hypothetical protein